MENDLEDEAPKSDKTRPAQSLEVWTAVYDGLSDEQIEAIDQVIKTRANLTRVFA
jgi:hypothetical protein